MGKKIELLIREVLQGRIALSQAPLRLCLCSLFSSKTHFSRQKLIKDFPSGFACMGVKPLPASLLALAGRFAGAPYYLP